VFTGQYVVAAAVLLSVVVSEVLLMQDKHHEAEPLLSLAVQIFIGQLGSSHPATQRAHTLLKQATNPRTSTASSFSLGMRMSGALQEASSSKLQSVDSKQPAPAAPAAAAAAAADKTGSTAEMPSFGAAAAQQQPEEQQRQQEQDVTVPLTDRTELAADDTEGQAVTAGGVSSTAVEVTAAALAGSAAATASGAASPSGRSMPANVSIASNINDFAFGGTAGAATAAAYGGYMSMDAGGSPVGSEKGLHSAEVLLQPHAAAGDAAAQGSSSQQLEHAASSMPSDDAAAPADPSEWELGRQFGQTAPVAATGVDDADAGQRAYTKVLHELTRRTSLGSHDGARDTLVTANSDAAAIAAAAAAETGGVVLAPAVVPEPAAPAAVPAAARAGSASRDSSASAGGVLGRQTVVEDAAAELEAAAMAEEDDKLAKLHQAGVGDIDQLRQFLREHGWQLSRLSKSEDKDVSGSRGWQAARDALASGAYSSRSATAAAAGVPGRSGSGQVDEMREQLVRGAAAGGRGDGSTQRRPPARHYSFLGPGQQPGGTSGTPGLEAVQELSSNTLQQLAMTSAELRALQAVQAGAAPTQAQAAMMAGGRMPHSMPGLEQQQQMRAAQQYMQQSLPEMPLGVGWPGQDGTIDEEEEEAAAAAAEDMMYQQMAQAESEAAIARLRAEQGWMNSQQQYQQQARQFPPGRGAHTMSNGELSAHLRQVRQHQFGPEAAYSEEDVMMTLRQQQQQHPYGRQAAPQQQRGRKRRDSWDASYGPTHPMAAAAAAAAAACEFNVSGAEDEADLRARFEALQQQMLQAQQQAGGWHQQQQQQEYLMAQGHPDALQTSYSAALPGAAAVRAQSAQLPASLQQRGSSSMQQYSQLSPASSLQADLSSRQAAHGAVAPAAAAAAGVGMPGTLFKHPSNISSYSAGSNRSLPIGQADHAAAADAAASAEQQQQAGQAHEAYEQQQQQQQNVAMKARSALSMARQGSTGALSTASDAAAAAAAATGGGASAGASARSESTLSPPAGFSAPSSGRSGHHRPAKRNVSFKLNKHQLHAAMQHQQMEDGEVGDSFDLGSGSPRSAAAAAAMFGAGRQGSAAALPQQQQRVLSARSAGSRPRSPLVHSMDEQAAQAMLGHASFSQHSPHASFASQPMLPDSIEADNMDAYYSATEMRVSPGPGMSGFGMPRFMARPHTAGAAGMSGMQQQERGAPLAPVRGPPSAGRNRSFNNGLQQQGVAGNSWDGGDPARTHQQLLLQQQVLQVQAARLELQKQQLEIEQLLNQQQHEQQAANSGQWPAMSMASSFGTGTPISPAASMPVPPQQQQQQRTPSQQYYQQGYGGGAAAYPNIAGYPLQPATSSASTMSISSPTSMQQQPPMQMQMPRGGVLEQVLDSSTAAGGGAAGSGQQQQQTGYGLPQIMTGPSPQSSMHTGSSFVPSSPSADSSLSSRPALSRGASDNQEAQVAAVMTAQMGVGRAQQQQQQQRPGSPGVGKRGSGTGGGLVGGPGSSSSGGRQQQQQQQGQLHRLHSQRSYEESEMLGAGTPSHMAASAGMAPNQQHMGWPGVQGQQQALQQQLAMQQLAMQQQQQQMPGRMGGRQMHPPAVAAGAGPGIAWRSGMQPGGAAAASASGPLGGIRTQQGSSWMGQPAVVYSGPLGRPMHPGVAAAAAGAGAGPAMRGHPGIAGSGPLSRMEMHQLQQQQQMAHPSFPGHHPAAAASWQQQQQQQQQQLQHEYYAAAQGMDAYQLQQLQQQFQQQMLQQQHEQPPPGSEDYDMWSAPPDYGGANSNMATSSGVGSSNQPHDKSRGGSFTRSFIAPGGGQYWEGRRSNSFSNLEGVEAHAAAAGSAGSMGRMGIARSRSSSELAHEGEQRQQ
jgi:hypothetical protein